eukprot:2191713-Amphidinium_carterae.1
MIPAMQQITQSFHAFKHLFDSGDLLLRHTQADGLQASDSYLQDGSQTRLEDDQQAAKDKEAGDMQLLLCTPKKDDGNATPELMAADAKLGKPPQVDHAAWMESMSDAGVDDMLLAGADAKQLLKVQAICNAQQSPAALEKRACPDSVDSKRSCVSTSKRSRHSVNLDEE